MRKLSMEELDRISVEEFKSIDKNPIIVILDNVRSLNNVGSAFRTADAFKIEKICLCGITGTPPHRDIRKTALGATESVAWEYFDKTIEAIIKYKDLGYKTIAVEQTDKAHSLESFSIKPDEKYVFVFGNEVFGIEDDSLKNCDLALEIPQFGTKHSLNISVSVGVILWHSVNQILNK